VGNCCNQLGVLYKVFHRDHALATKPIEIIHMATPMPARISLAAEVPGRTTAPTKKTIPNIPNKLANATKRPDFFIRTPGNEKYGRRKTLGAGKLNGGTQSP
jgi:hypothetical protein